MPKQAARIDAVEKVFPLGKIANHLVSWLRRKAAA
jgi:chemotaxis response regulator CheB